MNRGAWILIGLLVAPAFGADQKKPKKEDRPTEATAEELLKQAEAKRAAGDTAGAIEDLKRAAALPGSSGDASSKLGRLLEGKGELDTAMDAYRAASEKLTGVAKGEALGRLSVLQELRGSPESATTAEAAATADPGGAWPAIALSRARARAGHGDEAMSLALKAKAGGGAAASEALGYAQEARGDLAAAETAYRESVAAEPGRIPASVGLARVLRKRGKAAEAEPLLKTVLEAAPGAVDAYKESARVKLALHRADDASGDAATAAAMAEGDAEAQALVKEVSVAKALEELRLNQQDLALQELTALKEKDPGFAPARVGLARVLMVKRQADAAGVELQKAIELQPDLAEAHYQLGYLNYVLRGNAAAAVPAYQKAVSLDPSNVEYRTYLGAALGDANQVDAAVAELQKVTQAPGYDRPDAWIYMGAAQLRAKRNKDAIPALDKAVALAPTNAQAEAYLGWCYFGLKDAENFKKHAGKARDLGYKEPKLLEYLARIEKGEPIK